MSPGTAAEMGKLGSGRLLGERIRRGLIDGLLIGLVSGFLSVCSEEGNDSALEILRGVVENGGGNGSCGEENMNSRLWALCSLSSK